jgi:hypothetical protein
MLRLHSPHQNCGDCRSEFETNWCFTAVTVGILPSKERPSSSRHRRHGPHQYVLPPPAPPRSLTQGRPPLRPQPRAPDDAHPQNRAPQPAQRCVSVRELMHPDRPRRRCPVHQDQVCAQRRARGCWVLRVRAAGDGAPAKLQSASRFLGRRSRLIFFRVV